MTLNRDKLLGNISKASSRYSKQADNVEIERCRNLNDAQLRKTAVGKLKNGNRLDKI
jgi:hypothetical protein